jgi:XTP/dITP diphosphohydrolase
MNKIIFATNNKNKVEEVKSILNNRFIVCGLKEAGILVDMEEPYDTLEENARAKSTFIYSLTKESCFSEDTGLEVFSLNGEPGVKSARYAGEECDNKKNIAKLLQQLSHTESREAQFKTVISLILNGQEYQFTGICKGVITKAEKGLNGFGYDSVFIPDGSTRSFAEMTMEEKNIFSHRKKATIQFIDFLTAHHGTN